MGFSVSASAAIVFISFLIAVGTLYTAWDNTYSEVQAAREFWYSLKLSQLNFKIGDVSVSPSTNNSNVDLTFKFLGQTIPGRVDILHNGVYVDFTDLNYLIPGNDYTVTIPGGADTSGSSNQVVLAFDNGCTLLVTYHYDTANGVYVVDSASTQCPVEVS
ncbi:flagellar protein [Thermococci archaeon]|nr:MAG: flagellar protein [Thermococci archaeon]